MIMGKKISTALRRKFKKIKLVVTDADGVLTDGGMYYSKDGEELKKFNTKDGMAVELLGKANIGTIIMTRENSKTVQQRGKKIKVLETIIGACEKEKLLDSICQRYKVSPDEIAYIGDDINDLLIMKRVGVSCVPMDSVEIIKKAADYKCEKKGGEGVLREVSEIILLFKNKA